MKRIKLTKRVQNTVCNLIEAGHFNTTAAKAAGISEKTLYLWMEKGDPRHPKHRKIFGDFLIAVNSAIAASEVNLLKDVLGGGPRMSLEVLKRRFPNRWGDKQRLEHTTPQGESLNLNHSGKIDGNNSPSASVQIVISGNDVWSDKDQSDGESRAAANSEEQSKIQLKENAANMPSETDDE